MWKLNYPYNSVKESAEPTLNMNVWKETGDIPFDLFIETDQISRHHPTSQATTRADATLKSMPYQQGWIFIIHNSLNRHHVTANKEALCKECVINNLK